MEMGSKFFWMQVFLGRNFREQVLEEKILLGASFGGGNWGEQKFLEGILASKISFWEEKKTGEQKCFRKG